MMSGLLEIAARRFLFAFDPETAHAMSIAALKSGLLPVCKPAEDPRLAVTVAGLSFPNPLGMAAGYDKNAEVPRALAGFGFGFVEVGTVTPKPQPGNAKPRIFRLVEDEAVINRLGFNNAGHQAVKSRLLNNGNAPGIIGINIGANKESDDRIADYVEGIREFAPIASYLTINISSPNTPGLRSLQSGEQLSELLSRVTRQRAASPNPHVPIFLKIAPDLEEADLEAIAQNVKSHGVDGLVISNTTLSRNGLTARDHIGETGGLSGKPLFERSTVLLAKMRVLAGKDMPLIGVGGINSVETAVEKIRAGADLLQLYTGMIYEGPGLPARIVRGLSRFLDENGFAQLSGIRDSRTEYWASRAL